MKHTPIETKYWDTRMVGINSLDIDIRVAVEELEQDGYSEGIVNIHYDENLGTHLFEVVMLEQGWVESEEEFASKYVREDDSLDLEVLVPDFDELLEEMDEELQEVVEEYNLVPSGYAVYFGWWEGNIATMIHPVS